MTEDARGRTVVSVIALLALACGLAAAQPQASFTISSYTAAALSASPEVRSAQDSWQAAEAAYRSQVAAMALPTLAFTGTAYPYGDNPANSYAFRTWRLNRSDMSFNTTLNLNLFNSFQDYERVRSAELARQSARRTLLAARQDRAFAAAQAFYDLDSKAGLLDVALQNLKDQQDQYAQSLDLYKNGMKSLADLLKSETDLRSSQLRLVQAQADQRTSLITFNALIDRDRLQPAPLSADLQPGATVLPLLDDDTARALVQRPEVARAQKDLERAKTALTQAVQGLLPTLRMDATWNHTDTANFGGTAVSAASVGIPNPNYYIGLSLSLPLGFNGVSQAYAVVQAKAQERSAQADLAAQERAVRTDVASAYVNLEKAMDSYTVAIVKERIAKRSLDLVSSQYQQGSADAIRMNQAQGDYLDARVQRVLALHDIFIDRAQYTRAVGDPLW